MKRYAILLPLMMIAVSAAGQSEITIDDAGPSSGFSPQVDEYVIEPGDTLWGITERVVGDPFLWPKVWAFNPEITNPHWIYPGDMLRFYPPEEQLPRSTEFIAGDMDLPPVDEIGPGGEDESYTEVEAPSIEIVDSQAAQKRAFKPEMFVGLFVTAQELAEAGRLTNAKNDAILLAAGDEVYLTFPENKQPQAKDRYLVFRTLREVEHPITGSNWGYVTQVTSLAYVLRNEAAVSRAVLFDTQVEVERGQFVTPMTRSPRMKLTRKPSRNRLQGYVLTIRELPATIAGYSQVIFIDKGSNDGVEIGNEFRVLDRGDKLTDDIEGMPFFDIGRLLVVDTKATASTCLVVASNRELEAGHMVQSVVSLRPQKPEKPAGSTRH